MVLLYNWKYVVVQTTTVLFLWMMLLLLLSSPSFVLLPVVSSSMIQVPISHYGTFDKDKFIASTNTLQRRQQQRRRQQSTKSVPFGFKFISNDKKSKEDDDNNNYVDNDNIINSVQHCNIVTSMGTLVSTRGGSAGVAIVKKSLLSTLIRGSILRIASDLTGGTPLESIKTRVSITKENAIEATTYLYNNYGITGFYTGSTSRTIEGALIGAVFMLGSTITKRQLLVIGCSPTISALAGGLVGGVAQSIVMTPAGMIFTSLSSNLSKKDNGKTKNNIGKTNENAITICQRVIKEKGIGGLYTGIGPMCLRQATNWASRSGFTEIARTTLKLSQYGLYGELLSGIIGGVGSCWNTPIETIRVFSQRDVCIGVQPKSMSQYWSSIVDESGYQGLFRGVTPRAIQAIWQTTFLVVVPNIIGL